MTLTQIIPRLYIGSRDDAGDVETTTSTGITAILTLTHSDPPTGYPEEITVAHRPLGDGPRNDVDNFRDAVERLLALLDAGETVLVHCSAGTSRSGAVAAGALARRDDIDAGTALARIQSENPDVEPHHALLDHARRIAR